MLSATGMAAGVFGTLGVVPIFLNVGAAVVPAIIAGLTNIVGVLVKPKELARLIRRKPHVPLIALAVLGGIGFGGWWIAMAVAAGGREGPKPVTWSDVALAILEYERTGGVEPFVPLPPQAQNSDVVFRLNPARAGYDGGPVPHEVRPLWRYSEYPEEMVLSTPTVFGTRVYGATCLLDIGANYGAIVCLDAETGKKIWSVDKLEGKELKAFFSSPALTADGKYLVIGQGLHFDTDCALICLEADTGALHWRIPTPLHIEGSPAVRGDLAVAGAGAVEGEDRKPKGDPGYVIGVRISDGQVLWKQPVADPESSPIIAEDGLVYIGSGFNGNAVVCLRSEPDDELQARGLERILWRTPTDYPATGAVTLVGDLVLIGCGNGDYVYADPNPAGVVMALDRFTGRVRWQTSMPDAVLGAVAVNGEMVVCPVRDGHVVALHLADGTPAWPEPREVSGRAPVLAAPAFDGRFVYAVSKDGYLAILNASDGSLVARQYLNDESRPGEMGLCISSPTVAGGRIYVGSETGGLICLASQPQ